MSEQVTFDNSISLDHIGRIYQMIGNIPFFAEKKARINSIEVLPGGLTNSNYKVTVNNVAYAVRIAGPGTEEYLNRPAEKHAATLMAELNINAPVIWYDEKTGCQVCLYIHGKPCIYLICRKRNISKKLPRYLKNTISQGKSLFPGLIC